MLLLAGWRVTICGRIIREEHHRERSTAFLEIGRTGLPALARSHPRRPPVSCRNLFQRDSCVRQFSESRRRMVAAGSGRSLAPRPTPTDKVAVDWRAWFSAPTRSANNMSCSLIRSPSLSPSIFRMGLHMHAQSVCTSSRSPVQHRGVGSSDNPNIGGSQ